MNSCELCSNIGRYKRTVGYIHPSDPDSILIYDDKYDEYDIWSDCPDSYYSGVLIRNVLYCPKCGRKLKEVDDG